MLKMPFIIQKELSKEFVLFWSVTLPLSLDAPGNNIQFGNLVGIVKAAICAEQKFVTRLIVKCICIRQIVLLYI